MGQYLSAGITRRNETFGEQLIRVLQLSVQTFALLTPGYAFDWRSRWAYAFSELADDHSEKPRYEKMAALRAANFAALRIGWTLAGQVVLEIEHRKLVAPEITNDVNNPGEFPKILRGLKQHIHRFEMAAGMQRNTLWNFIESGNEFKAMTKYYAPANPANTNRLQDKRIRLDL